MLLMLHLVICSGEPAHMETAPDGANHSTASLQALEIGAKEGSEEPQIKVLGEAAGPQLPHMARANAFVSRSFGSIGAVSRL